ncbi:Rhamnogalacturonides degradation protein RhiN [Granulicella sibirica]|uniref:Rhamnogalacturonides degradation protein RhiN n=2 Tax=Granulicella sibirica TaxID=2479048 RepID=A0A4Q0SZT2_9BACT|nr:Rhamnogalacturonides degradation protein RhiN [Granulicella sibirica]
MADTVVAKWPKAYLPSLNTPGKWTYEEGVLLDGMTAEWRVTGDRRYFEYLKGTIDPHIDGDATGAVPIIGYPADQHSLDNIKTGQSLLTLYRVTLQPKYYRAAKYVRDQLREQKRTPSGGFWHKDIYPNQVWLDGAYMAGPFLAEYGATFHESEAFDEAVGELILMDSKMRDPKTGLMRHGWDESKQMPWADPVTGLSPEVWARAMGWYAMALVDVLEWLPEDYPRRPALLAALNRTAQAITKYQDSTTGLWYQVVDKQAQPGNYFEQSASSMFVYALAKGARLGYLPQNDEANARKGWAGIQKKFVTSGADGLVSLGGTVKVGGLGGKPYRSGTFDYYVHEPVIADDAKGIGAYLLAGSEMEQADTEAKAQGKTVLVDAWFNSQTRTNAAGQTELFHYKWDDDSNNGFSFFGRMFQRYGMRLAEQKTAPTPADLKRVSIYIFASPDIPSKNPRPSYMDPKTVEVVADWVKAGGVLVLMQNDGPNAEFEHFDALGDRFGIHFNPVLRNHVLTEDKTPGLLTIPAGAGGIFEREHHTYMKDTCTITVSGAAKAALTDKGDVMMATVRYGKGIVYAVVDPWLYNEYTDGRNLTPSIDTFAAGLDLVHWLAGEAK